MNSEENKQNIPEVTENIQEVVPQVNIENVPAPVPVAAEDEEPILDLESTLVKKPIPTPSNIEIHETGTGPVVLTDAPIVEEKNNEVPVTTEVTPTVEFTVKKQNVTIDEDYRMPEDPKVLGPIVALPSVFDGELEETFDKAGRVDYQGSGQGRFWASVVREGRSLQQSIDSFVDSLSEEGSDWKQYVEFNGKKLTGFQPKFRAPTNKNLQGEAAVVQVMDYLGLGSCWATPLWHSGFWVTFKAPQESEIVELNRILFSDKIRLGRETYGFIFSNTTSYTVDRIVNFALDHVFDCTLKDDRVGTRELRDLIKTQDIPALLVGFMTTVYVRGFNYRRACTSNPDKCNHVVEELINLSKLVWENNKALTDWQKSHMSSRQPASKDLATVQRYQDELIKLKDKTVNLVATSGAELKITLKSPNVSEYINAGYKWVSNIVTAVESVMVAEASAEERERQINLHARATMLRQYSHWIRSIEMVDGNIIDDDETLESTLSMISADESIVESFMEEVVKYIDSSTIVVVGVPSFTCPKCGDPQVEGKTLPDHVNIIPLDVITLFFALVTHRVGRLVSQQGMVQG